MADRQKNAGSQKRCGKGKKSYKNPECHSRLHQEGTAEHQIELCNTSEKLISKDPSIPNVYSDGNKSLSCDDVSSKGNVPTKATNAAIENDVSVMNAPCAIHKVEKTREEILAEREARKLAKQALKKKEKKPNLNKNMSETVNHIVKEGKKPESQNYSQDKDNVKQMAKSQFILTYGSKDGGVEGSTEGLPSISVNEEQNEGKSKAQLRAERRAKQEAQRAKKLNKTNATNEKTIFQASEIIKSNKTLSQSQNKVHKVKLFAHLYSELFNTIEIDLCEDAHSSIVQLGTQYRSKVISGGNARCLALLNAFKTIIEDYETPPNQELPRGLEAEISKSMMFLNKCRPVSVSMVNAVKHLKFQVNQLKGEEGEIKKQLNDWIDIYIKEQIEKASEAISLFVLQKITNEDVILIYSCSSLVQRILLKARDKSIKFRVIVVDGRPWLEGKEMLRRLVRAGINCTYVFFNGLSFVMPEVTKILLGAHALLANGYVMSRAGSSQIALLGRTYNVPVLVCCETHKFSEKVQTDSFVHNELGDPDKLITNDARTYKEPSNWKNMQYLTPLNLTYDVTPPDLVSAVVTEVAVLPCTSVPVILRIKPPDLIC